jgi:protein O-mannosyl-transferase
LTGEERPVSVAPRGTSSEPGATPPSRATLAALLVAAVALAASIGGIRNYWALDDIPLIQLDARAHSFALVDSTFTSSYWPAPLYPDLYRPLATLSFTAQWVAGGGSPMLFRVVSYLLYAAVSLAVLAFARRILPFGFALVVALLFACHPVHVEAVALGVNQGEQWVALLTLIAASRYFDARRSGGPTPVQWAQLGALYLAACLFKENAVVMPAMLAAIELIPQERADPRPWRRLVGGFAALIAVGAAFLLLRTWILGNAIGSAPAPALVGLGVSGRAMTMLEVFGEWVRLLVFPLRLQGDYSPAVIEGATHWGWLQTRGAFLLVAVGAIVVLARRREALVAFGVGWAAIAVLPVSNVLVPTGITLAERSLFLPSVGFIFAAVGIYSLLRRNQAVKLSKAEIGVVVAVVALGIARSELRQRDWRDQATFWTQTLRQAVISYKPYQALAEVLYSQGEKTVAFRYLHKAIVLNPKDSQLSHQLANWYAESGNCGAAVLWYREALRLDPDRITARERLISCLSSLGREDEAHREAQEALRILEARPE